MIKNPIVRRGIAAVSLLAMTAALAACGDNVPANSSSSSASSNSSEKISGEYAGAGASSQQAAVEALIAGYESNNSGVKVTYNPTGSGAGVSSFLTGALAWAGSDAALTADQVEQSKSVCAKGTAFDVPVYVSPIAVAYNLKGISDQGKHVKMDASTIAKIFDGKITTWNDPAIAGLNPDLKLPATPITVVHRSDKSGTTQNFLSYVKDAAPNDWPYDLSENWPNSVGQGSKGTSGVISTIKQADGTIGYADFSQVGNLGTVAVKVGDGYSEISAAAASKVVDASPLDESAKGANRVVVKIDHNTTAKGAYPIVLVSYDVACPAYKDTKTAQFVKSWLTYVTSADGQKAAEDAAGSAPLPSKLTGKIAKSIDAISTK